MSLQHFDHCDDAYSLSIRVQPRLNRIVFVKGHRSGSIRGVHVWRVTSLWHFLSVLVDKVFAALLWNKPVGAQRIFAKNVSMKSHLLDGVPCL